MADEPSLRDTLMAAHGDDAGDQPEGTPEPAPAPVEAPEGQDTENQEPVSTPAGSPDEPLFTSLTPEQIKEHPFLQERARQMQADYTRKAQQLAEQRKSIEGLPESDIAWLRSVSEAARLNPAAARQMLQQAAEQIAAEHHTEEAPMEWASDGEQLLYNKLSQVERFIEEQRLANNRMEAERQFSELEKEFGQITGEQKYRVIEQMSQMQAPLAQIPLFYRGMFGYQQALSKGRSEGSASVAQKNGIGPPPSGVVSRPIEDAPDPSKMSHAEYLRATVPDA